ncbi:MAG: InlB B-repeat-containing protein, partial [Lachnospiraceae bacterium]|nr:InlB B-repeat-containing protein [Lachnospiraceae bacterium]
MKKNCKIKKALILFLCFSLLLLIKKETVYAEKSNNINTSILYSAETAQYYTTYFDGNGGSCSKTSDSYKCGTAYGTLPTPTRSGYKFLGWYFNKNWADKDKVSSTTFVRSATVTLYARWEQIVSEKTYTVTYNANGGNCSVKSQQYTYGPNNRYTALPTATRTGYTFAGWYTSAEGGTKITTNTGVAATNRTLYAHWTVKAYTITYNANGGNCSVKSQQYTYGPNNRYTALPTATRTGYTFEGWYTSAEGGTKITTNTGVAATDRTLYAHWTARAYTVKFNANGGTCETKSQKYIYGPTNRYTALPTATRTGYTFAGWYTSAEGGTKITTNTGVAATDRTLYAHWTARTYTVKFNANGGTCETKSQKYVYGPTTRYTALPTAERAGYL